MKNLFLFTFSLPLYLLAQVGIGTSSPNTSAKLEVSASNKGFLPPRVTLSGTTDVSTIATPATGLLVYNTATAGASPNNVTPGFYYYDGSKWQRIINQQPDATVEFSVNSDPNTGGTTFSGTAASKDYIYVSTINNSQWSYNGTAYVTYTPPASTAWYLSGGTNDAGSNKTGSIYRSGNVGIGISPTTRLHSYLADGTNDNQLLIQQGSNGRASGLLLRGNNDAGTSWNFISSQTGSSTDMWRIGGGGVNNTLTMSTAGSERLRITSGGDVGIGSTSPSAKLHVEASATTAPSLTWNASSGQILRNEAAELAIGLSNSSPWPMYLQARTNANAQKDIAINPLGGNVGIGNSAPNARLDIRTSPTSTTDPGAGYFGVGTTSTAANTAGAGAVRYNTSNGGVLEFSNGTNWNTLTSNVQKATVVAKKTSAQSVSHITATDVTNWDEITDVTNNFNPTTGVFTAPRAGNYVVSFSFNFVDGAINAGTVVEAQLISSGGTTNDKKSVVSYPASGTAPAGAVITFTIKLASGETVKPVIWHSLGATKSLRVGTGTDDGFVNFSVAEL